MGEPTKGKQNIVKCTIRTRQRIWVTKGTDRRNPHATEHNYSSHRRFYRFRAQFVKKAVHCSYGGWMDPDDELSNPTHSNGSRDSLHDDCKPPEITPCACCHKF
eukprot:3671335-Amphidinium_carterae.1